MVKFFDAATFSDVPYTLTVAAALRALGWPTPEPVEEPVTGPAGTWVLFRRLPGRPRERDEERSRGRLLAELHASAAATGITGQRDGFRDAVEVVTDPALDHWLRVHERARPDEGRELRAGRDAAARWFAENDTSAAPRSVIHSDFAPWNLLFDDGRLTGVLDFEGTHHTFQVADFALSWRGYQDDVLRGYDEVRPLSDLEWRLIRPTFVAWLFIDVANVLAAHHGRSGPVPDLRWQIAHLRKRSPLLDKMT